MEKTRNVLTLPEIYELEKNEIIKKYDELGIKEDKELLGIEKYFLEKFLKKNENLEKIRDLEEYSIYDVYHRELLRRGDIPYNYLKENFIDIQEDIWNKFPDLENCKILSENINFLIKADLKDPEFLEKYNEIVNYYINKEDLEKTIKIQDVIHSNCEIACIENNPDMKIALSKIKTGTDLSNSVTFSNSQIENIVGTVGIKKLVVHLKENEDFKKNFFLNLTENLENPSFNTIVFEKVLNEKLSDIYFEEINSVLPINEGNAKNIKENGLKNESINAWIECKNILKKLLIKEQIINVLESSIDDKEKAFNAIKKDYEETLDKTPIFAKMPISSFQIAVSSYINNSIKVNFSEENLGNYITKNIDNIYSIEHLDYKKLDWEEEFKEKFNHFVIDIGKKLNINIENKFKEKEL